jgi:hypothetical protein
VIAAQLVVTAAADDQVVSRAADDHVGAAGEAGDLQGQAVLAELEVVGRHHVVALLGIDDVVAETADDDVVEIAAVYGVVAGAAVDAGATVEADLDDVVAGAAFDLEFDRGGDAGEVDDVVAIAALDDQALADCE